MFGSFRFLAEGHEFVRQFCFLAEGHQFVRQFFGPTRTREGQLREAFSVVCERGGHIGPPPQRFPWVSHR